MEELITFFNHIGRHNIFTVFICKDRMGDHALSEETCKGLAAGQIEQSTIAQPACKETRIEQMQNCMFDPANILINGKPITGDFFIKGFVIRQTISLAACKTREVPRAIGKSIECISFAASRFSTCGAIHIFKGRVTIQRITGFVKIDIIGQGYRQVGFGHRDDPTVSTVNHGYWTAPIALSRNPPISQAILCHAFAEFHLFDFGNSGFNTV